MPSHSLTAVPLPVLTNAHQQHLQSLVAALHSSGQLSEGDLAFLSHLAADLPRLRAGLPKNAQEVLHELDTNQAALHAALASVADVSATYLHTFEGDALHPQHMLDAAHLACLGERLHALAQHAAEGALRAQQRASLLDQRFAE